MKRREFFSFAAQKSKSVFYEGIAKKIPRIGLRPSRVHTGRGFYVDLYPMWGMRKSMSLPSHILSGYGPGRGLWQYAIY